MGFVWVSGVWVRGVHPLVTLPGHTSPHHTSCSHPPAHMSLVTPPGHTPPCSHPLPQVTHTPDHTPPSHPLVTHTNSQLHAEIHTSCSIACWDTHPPPTPLHVWIHTPCPIACWDTHPLPHCMLEYTPLAPLHAGIHPPLWTEWQTGVKTLPFPKLRLRAVTKHTFQYEARVRVVHLW